MKTMKKIAAIMLSVMMVLGMCSVVGAEGATSGTSAANQGKITINNAKKGQTYTIYRILELESFSEKTETPGTGNYAYKVANGWGDFFKKGAKGLEYVTIDDAGYVTWKNGKDVAAFAKEALAFAKEKSITYTRQNPNVSNTTVIFDNLPLGYYLVDSSTGALCSLDTTATDVTIQEKNEEPTLNKQVKEDSNNQWGTENTADIGQKVEFQVTIEAKKGAENYVLHDVMSEGLTFDSGSVKVVKKTGETTTDLNVNGDTEYTLKTSTTESAGQKCTFEVVFAKTFCDTLINDDTLIVTYSATLNENAVVAGDGNVNTAKLEYGDNHFTATNKTTTKTYEIPVLKYTNKSSVDTPLAGAVFELYRDENCTPAKQIKLINKGKEGSTNYDLYRIATSETKAVTQITTTTDGKFKIYGLDADTYYLKEVKPPVGYNKLTSPIEIKIDTDGKIYVNKSKTANSEDVKVLNNTGSLLPSTGGMGTTLFYIFGAILVIGSGVVLITKKRMK